MLKTITRKRKSLETVTGAAIGAAVAGPVGAVAGGLAAGHVESGWTILQSLNPHAAATSLAQTTQSFTFIPDAS